MAYVTLNPVIKSISGRVDSAVFYHYNDRQFMRRYVIPRNPDTPAQRVLRARFAEAVSAWQCLAPYKKEQWNGKALHACMSGYNLFISAQMRKTAESETIESTQEATTPASSSLLVHSHSVSGSEPLRNSFAIRSP